MRRTVAALCCCLALSACTDPNGRRAFLSTAAGAAAGLGTMALTGDPYAAGAVGIGVAAAAATLIPSVPCTIRTHADTDAVIKGDVVGKGYGNRHQTSDCVHYGDQDVGSNLGPATQVTKGDSAATTITEEESIANRQAQLANRAGGGGVSTAYEEGPMLDYVPYGY